MCPGGRQCSLSEEVELRLMQAYQGLSHQAGKRGPAVGMVVLSAAEASYSLPSSREPELALCCIQIVQTGELDL